MTLSPAWLLLCHAHPETASSANEAVRHRAVCIIRLMIGSTLDVIDSSFQCGCSFGAQCCVITIQTKVAWSFWPTELAKSRNDDRPAVDGIIDASFGGRWRCRNGSPVY